MKYIVMLSALFFGVSVSTAFSQDHSQHQAQGTADHSQHQAAGTDHMAHLDADLEEIRKTEDPAKRKQMLQHHLQMMREQAKQMHASMNHGDMGQGQAMDSMMMQHHHDMGKMMDHMLSMQELMLALIDTK